MVAWRIGTFGIVRGTPVERHRGIWVKREDLSAPAPGPEFSKYRGVVSHIKERPETLIGVLDTLHSKAGWAVAYACSFLGKQCLDFYPHYKAEAVGTIRSNQLTAAWMGAELVPLPAGRSFILYHTARKETEARGGYMMPNALKLPESVRANAAEARRTDTERFGTIAISVSSGTIAAGVIRGVVGKGEEPLFLLHMGYSRPEGSVRSYVEKMAALDRPLPEIAFVDESFQYKDAVHIETPFPCNPHYDAKTYRWLLEHKDELPQPVLFWSIGS